MTPSKLISSNWSSTVWSPYAIPQAVSLHHYYKSKTRWSSIDFECKWEYDLWDFENENYSYRNESSLLCCNRLEGKIDDINTCGLNKATYNKIRNFLFGTASKESEVISCSALNFWRLLFASMGTTDPRLTDTLHYHGGVGKVVSGKGSGGRGDGGRSDWTV
ncbi:hypothetical protein ACHAWO_007469 [Cyclotella atomus]|jgi:hypothetical protein|uniref:Uncharacterized protein n=1 Tax=Cyclotella atomus TaxID=382360 RepID=A0ABD3PMS9_9STRA